MFSCASCTSLSLSIAVHMFHTQLFPVHYSGCALCTSLFTVQLQYSGCASCTSLFTLQLQYSGCASCTSVFTVQFNCTVNTDVHEAHPLYCNCRVKKDAQAHPLYCNTIHWMCLCTSFFTVHYIIFHFIDQSFM